MKKSKIINILKEAFELEKNPKDIVRIDIPLFIRLLEYAREDAKTDMDLHTVTEKCIEMSVSGKTLSMEDYSQIVGK